METEALKRSFPVFTIGWNAITDEMTDVLIFGHCKAKVKYLRQNRPQSMKLWSIFFSALKIQQLKWRLSLFKKKVKDKKLITSMNSGGLRKLCVMCKILLNRLLAIKELATLRGQSVPPLCLCGEG